MGMLEDLLLGADAFFPDYGQTGMDLSPEERRRLIEERMRGYKPLIPMLSEAAGLTQEDIESQSALEAGLVSSPEPQGSAVEESVAIQELAQQEEAAAPQRAADKIAELQRQTNQSSLDALEQMPAEKLMAIRAQAKAKGRAGSLGANVQPTEEDYASVGGGGSFSQQADSPELQARLRERDEWTAGQPMRDLEFAMTPEQARRNPAYAKSAGETLTGLKEQQAIGRRQQIQELFVNKLAGSGGTIPRDKAAQLQALGVDVPYGATGSSVDEGAAFFDDAISKAGTFLAQLDQVDATSGHPMIKVQKYGAMLAEKYKQLVAAGQINPDDAIKQWKSEIAQLALSQGLINTQESASMTQQ